VGPVGQKSSGSAGQRSTRPAGVSGSRRVRREDCVWGTWTIRELLCLILGFPNKCQRLHGENIAEQWLAIAYKQGYDSDF
jgi:hypothetical protein